MKTVKLILGNISFEPGCAIVHEIEALINCVDEKRAHELGEELVNEYGAYLIPSEFDGKITYEIDENILTH